MTGISYRAIDCGPFPAEYDLLYPTLTREGKIKITNIELPHDYDGKNLKELQARVKMILTKQRSLF